MNKTHKTNYILTLISILCGLFILFPIIWLVLSSFKPSNELFGYPLTVFPENPTFDHYFNVIDDGFFTYVGNSFFLAVVGTAITLAISSMCGYALAAYRNEVKYTRSEEHTSELQSRFDLVCRLLL